MTVEAYRPVARTVEQLVNDYLHERPTIRFADFQPNILMAIDAVKEIKIADESLRWGGPNIRTAIRLVAAGEFRNPEGGLRFQFAENPRFRATLDYAIYDAHLDEKGNPKLARSTGTENMV